MWITLRIAGPPTVKPVDETVDISSSVVATFCSNPQFQQNNLIEKKPRTAAFRFGESWPLRFPGSRLRSRETP